MKIPVTKKSSPLKVVLLLIGFTISGLILAEGFDKNNSLISESETYDSLKTNIESKKSLIVNTYLLGVSIYQKAVD